MYDTILIIDSIESSHEKSAYIFYELFTISNNIDGYDPEYLLRLFLEAVRCFKVKINPFVHELTKDIYEGMGIPASIEGLLGAAISKLVGKYPELWFIIDFYSMYVFYEDFIKMKVAPFDDEYEDHNRANVVAQALQYLERCFINKEQIFQNSFLTFITLNLILYFGFNYRLALTQQKDYTYEEIQSIFEAARSSLPKNFNPNK
jgi:hypothetical protein